MSLSPFESRLPDVVWREIFEFLTFNDVFQVAMTCRSWRNAVLDRYPSHWNRRILKYYKQLRRGHRCYREAEWLPLEGCLIRLGAASSVQAGRMLMVGLSPVLRYGGTALHWIAGYCPHWMVGWFLAECKRLSGEKVLIVSFVL
jgi:hypothetical protein